jgi:LmbE family N-acetylglucosaminyl deacetylase
MAAILAVHAHPDDIETLGAGTLAFLAARGHRIIIVTATAGEGGAVETGPEATAAIRQREAEAAAAVIGADYRCAGFADLGVFNDDPSRRRMTELIRVAKPDLVITASPVDYHPDHEAVSVLVRDACFASSVPNYQTGEAAALEAIPHLYFMDPIGGRTREGERVRPDFGVDIGAFLETKRRMLMTHQSQVEWVARQHGIAEYAGSMVAWAERRGRDFGVAYAEGFRQYRNQPYPATPALQDLLGGALLALADWPTTGEVEPNPMSQSLYLHASQLEPVYGWFEQHGEAKVEVWALENARRSALLAYGDGPPDAFGWSNWATSVAQDPSGLLSLFEELELAVDGDTATQLSAAFPGLFHAPSAPPV